MKKMYELWRTSMDTELYNACLSILKEELIPAMSV